MIRIGSAGRPECHKCSAVGQSHDRLTIVRVLLGKRAPDEVTCRRCGSRAFIVSGTDIIRVTQRRSN